MTADPIERCFPPVVDKATRLLLLGSLPGQRSLLHAQYYAHPQNQFWPLIGAVIGQDIAPLAYEQRLAALRQAGVGLWDTVASARRKGSLDMAIRLEQASDLPGLVAQLPSLRAIGFNGGTAARIGRRALAERGTEATAEIALIDLPSSSPAYTLPFAQKLESWRRLRAFLD